MPMFTMAAETQDKIKRLRADLRFDMLWPRLAGSLGILSVTSYASRSYWRLVGQGAEHHLSQAGIAIGLMPDISLDVAYKVGEEAPNFKHQCRRGHQILNCIGFPHIILRATLNKRQ